MIKAKAKMRIKFYFLICLISCLAVTNALNCRSEGGPKENELRTIYRNCLKRQENNSSDNGRYHGGRSKDQGRRTHETGVQKPDWDNSGNTDSKYDRRHGRIGNRDDRTGHRDEGTSNRDDGMSSREYQMGDANKRFGNRNDRLGGRESKMGDRDDRTSNGYGLNIDNYDSRFERDSRINGREDFPRNEFEGDMPRYPSSRFKRERRPEKNSSTRSQYNPNAQNSPDYDDSFRENQKNSTENTNKEMDAKACAIHCFLEQLQMTGDNGMPDRYMVTQTITKDVKDEDLKEFLQEAIEDCFQILYNENAENHCKFSKDLMLCLSEKGKANCDDWREDMQF